MDFLKILKSFEDFVYEALIWLVLLPKSLLRIVMHPIRMSSYVALELGRDDGEDRFGEAISPPLLLILCVLIAHFLDLAVRPQTPDASGSLAGLIFASDQYMLLYRTIAFGIWALAGAVYAQLRTGTVLGRQTLRTPFYEQCYLVAPFALLLSASGSLMLADRHNASLGACLGIAGFAWFVLVQIAWIRWRAHLPTWRGVIAGLLIVMAGSLTNAALGYALTHVSAPHVASGVDAASTQG